ncbi:MAG: hypothetical protein ISR78_09615 [Spirochaetia bacterium]|nr:hypothetical protein [Spirochaetia bacterium]
MKISNKILLGGFGVIVILLIAALITGKAVLNKEIDMRVSVQQDSIIRMID